MIILRFNVDLYTAHSNYMSFHSSVHIALVAKVGGPGFDSRRFPLSFVPFAISQVFGHNGHDCAHDQT